ncbi:Transcriptional activator spt7 [Hamiltosporidium tvaerminnensis]|nr:Transcriptional activator spt7 [Hamiltosporidium tvaerminnensis]
MYSLLSPDDLEEEIPFSIKILCSSVEKTKFIKEVLIPPIRKYQAILYTLKTNTPYSLPFLQKVSKKEAPDYLKIISKPMDLGLISRKINNYSVEGFYNDLELVWRNCFKYNCNNIFSEYCCRMKELCYKVLEYNGIGVGIEGVIDSRRVVEGVIDSRGVVEGVIDSRRVVEGVIDSRGVVEGVIDSRGVVEGVIDSRGVEEGVIDSRGVVEGVIDSRGVEEGVIDRFNKLEGVSNNTDTYHPVNNCTDTYHHVRPKEYWCYGRTGEMMGYYYSRECNNTLLYESIDNYKDMLEGVNDKDMLEGVNDSTSINTPLNNSIGNNTPLNDSTSINTPLNTSIGNNTPLLTHHTNNTPLIPMWDGEFLCNSFPVNYIKSDVSKVGVLFLNKYKNMIGLEEIKWGFQKEFKGGVYFKGKRNLKVSFLDKECVKSVIGDLFVIEVGKVGFKRVSKMAVDIAVDVLYKRVLDICRENVVK